MPYFKSAKVSPDLYNNTLTLSNMLVFMNNSRANQSLTVSAIQHLESHSRCYSAPVGSNRSLAPGVE